jgi:hypothetical protein
MPIRSIKRVLLSLAAVGELAVFAHGAARAEDAPGLERLETPAAPVGLPRVRAIHSTNVNDAGGSASLLFGDPWLGFVRGRDLFRREFTPADGVFGPTANVPQPVLEDGRTPMIVGARASSCALCHNTPLGDAGAGPTILKNGPSGRNSQHLYGGGLVEMVGQELRAKLLKLADADGNGFISREEAAGKVARVSPAPGEPEIDFGFFDDRDGDGQPDLNPAAYIWYVDANGRRLARARRLGDPGVAGYSFEMQVFGWGHATFAKDSVVRSPNSSTLRGFSAAAFHVHSGLQAFDPTLSTEAEKNGLTGVSLCGAQQFFTAKTLDRGRTIDTRGFSADDPDGDGMLEELTEGDMDLLEFYLLNHPPPAELERTAQRQRGRELFSQTGCTACHVPDWAITRDRRSFNLQTAFNAEHARIEGRLTMLTERAGGADGERPRGAPFLARGVYSDFAYHDLGPACHQLQFNGRTITHFKTPPLWGVGSTAPYGHDGASLDLESVILRHGGEAAESRTRYAALAENDRAALIAFLRGLVLMPLDELPCDVDGNGKIEEHERFDPLPRVKAPKLGAELPFLKDADGNGTPDIRQ